MRQAFRAARDRLFAASYSCGARTLLSSDVSSYLVNQQWFQHEGSNPPPLTSHRPRISLFLFITFSLSLSLSHSRSLFLPYILQFEAATFHFTTPRITCERTQLVVRKMDSRLLDGPPRPVIVSFAPTSSFTSAMRHRDANRAECSRREERPLLLNSRGYSFFSGFFFPRGKTFFRMHCNRGEIFLFSMRIREITFALFSRQRNFVNKRGERADSIQLIVF